MRFLIPILIMMTLSGCKEEADQQLPPLESLSNPILYNKILETCGEYLEAVEGFTQTDHQNRQTFGRQIVTTSIWLHGYSSGRFNEAMPDQQNFFVALSDSTRTFCEDVEPQESILGFFDYSVNQWKQKQAE